MGATENTFNAITNIFGFAGLVLYGSFMVQLGLRTWKGRRLSPERSVERAMCEFSFVNLSIFVVLAPVIGGVPGINLVYWALGVLAARPYLGKPEKAAPPAPAPAFDRSRQMLAPAKVPARDDLLGEFSRRQSGLRFERKERAV
jgi:hypothetical protein